MSVLLGPFRPAEAVTAAASEGRNAARWVEQGLEAGVSIEEIEARQRRGR